MFFLCHLEVDSIHHIHVTDIFSILPFHYDTKTQLTILDPSACPVFGTSAYSVGEEWRQGPCTHCKCLDTNKDECTREVCPPPSCEYFIFEPDVCCPVCQGMRNRGCCLSSPWVFRRGFCFCRVVSSSKRINSFKHLNMLRVVQHYDRLTFDLEHHEPLTL